MITCDFCNGEGKRGHFELNGSIYAHPCEKCKGKGRIKKCQYEFCREKATHEAIGYQGIESIESVYEMCEKHAAVVDEKYTKLR